VNWALFISKSLDDAFQLIIDNDILKAKKIVDSLSVITKIELESLPESCELFPNYPNPFNPSTRIKYSLSKTSQVNIQVVDMLGQKIADILKTDQVPGNYELNFNGTQLASGVYFLVLQTGSFLKTQKMVLAK
jgi:endo-1,4-beta-xylanase